MKLSKTIILASLLFGGMSYAQTEIPIELEEAKKEIKITPNNQIKVNLATLIWGTGSFNYERKVSDRWTLGFTANYRPKSTPPFKSTLQDIFGDKNKDFTDNSFDVDQLEYGNWSLSPEVKVYLGKSGAFKGFYIAGFAKYENIDIDYQYPLDITLNDQAFHTNLPLNGDLKTWSGGVYIGYQWNLGGSFYLDWQIIGGNFGGGNLEVYAYEALTSDEQEQIRSFAEDIQDQLGNLKYEINDDGAKIWGSIPWAGLRTGLSLGFVF